jgi:hypothetical protein
LTITETVNCDFGGAGSCATDVGGAAFSLPKRTTRGCSAKRDNLVMTKPQSSS